MGVKRGMKITCWGVHLPLENLPWYFWAREASLIPGSSRRGAGHRGSITCADKKEISYLSHWGFFSTVFTLEIAPRGAWGLQLA